MDGMIEVLYYINIMKPTDLIFLAGSEISKCSAFVDKHFLGYHTLQYMDSGEVELRYDSEPHHLTGFCFWPAMPGPRIRFHAAPGTATWSHRFLAFTGPLVQDWEEQGLLLHTPQKVENDQTARMNEIILLKDRRERFSTWRAIRLLELLLIDLAEERAAPALTRGWLETVVRELEDSRYWPDYPRLCAACRMSLPTLRRRFRKEMRISLHQYAMQARISRAGTLLTQSNPTIQSVADELGYSDVYFFSRQFRELTGLPPKRFRDSRQ